ncbi:substrate-binding domain-containing protein [Maribellus comscasis]|uniref:Substrate-binding domain-containing protein n=1 Tax=Maribellus comscasis TaxID=2681766 RepID=A0A6I6JNK5_9BACT|nr:LacI family DNA-binding transcriptional regulator [Maribellus comscasis]QGY42699.1 substrate-binding domain-containing protein [Maribellus comscasis]
MTKQAETTIHDIAKYLNISASTVSRALNDNPLISEATRKKIRKVANEMGYRPNTLAANFRTKRTNTIGVIVPLINRHFFSSVISGIEDIAYSQGYTVSISQSNDNFQKETKIAKTMFNNRVDGVIVSIGMETKSFEHLELFLERKIPLVFFDRAVDEINAHKIVVDDFGGAYRVTKHLIEQGAKKIAHIGGPTNLKIYEDRKQGFLEAMKDAGLKTDKKLIIHNSLRHDDGVDAIRKLMDKNKKIDAIFCANDTTALSAIVYLKELGIKIPEDILVMGFSNEPFSRVTTPSISTVKQPGFLMGQKAAELLIHQINNKKADIKYQTLVMPTELLIRESSQKNVLNLH